MKKYKGEVTNEINLEILIDENIWDDKTIKAWSGVFYPADNTKDIIEHLAESIMRNGIYSHHEGFGIVKVLDYDGVETSNNRGWNYCEGITVILCNDYEDGYIEANLKEV